MAKFHGHHLMVFVCLPTTALRKRIQLVIASVVNTTESRVVSSRRWASGHPVGGLSCVN